MKEFIALTILTGIVRKPELQMHWENDVLTVTPFFGQTMSRNRYLQISRYLHFHDNNDKNNDGDKLVKLRPVIDHLLNKFEENYQLHQPISIDEGTLKWKGRLSFRVYNPMKPCKYGIKSYILADSVSNYCYDLIIYDGISRPLRETVLILVQDHLNKNHMLYMDNLYNSVGLAEDLLDNGMYVTGTLRRNRGEPKAVTRAGTQGYVLARGESVDRDNGRVTVSAWQDNRTVRYLTTMHDNTREIVRVRQRGGAFQEVSKPVALCDYNRFMGGVDGVDQMLSYYPVVRKTVKWVKKLFWYFIELSLHNAHVIFNHGKNTKAEGKMTLLEFQKSVVKSLVYPEAEEKESAESDTDNEDVEGDLVDVGLQPLRVPRQPAKDSLGRMTGGFADHRLETFPPTPKRKYPQKRCRVCLKKDGRRKETRYWCSRCNVALCLGYCFEVYHRKKNPFKN